MKTTVALVVLIASYAAIPAGARAQAPRFDVISVKRSSPDAQGGGLRVSPGGRVALTNSTLKGLIAAAYQRYMWDSREIIGGPAWLNEMRFDVVAQATGGLPPVDADGFPSRLVAMLRATLEERFRLVAHWESRERPVYNLVMARPDRRLGPRLVSVVADCAQATTALLAGQPQRTRPGRGPECRLSPTSDPGSIQANAVTPGVLAHILASEGAGRDVIDRTGLSGTFDVDLLFMPEIALGGLSLDRIARDPLFQGRAGLFTALQEQLGLKLEPATGSVQVLVIDRAERPTED
jgi:uncharacterized protein (TIGR03435 family)